MKGYINLGSVRSTDLEPHMRYYFARHYLYPACNAGFTEAPHKGKFGMVHIMIGSRKLFSFHAYTDIHNNLWLRSKARQVELFPNNITACKAGVLWDSLAKVRKRRPVY